MDICGNHHALPEMCFRPFPKCIQCNEPNKMSTTSSQLPLHAAPKENILKAIK